MLSPSIFRVVIRTSRQENSAKIGKWYIIKHCLIIQNRILHVAIPIGSAISADLHYVQFSPTPMLVKPLIPVLHYVQFYPTPLLAHSRSPVLH